MSTTMVKIGDTVLWRGCFGKDAPRRAVVEWMEITEAPRMKDGEEAEEAPWTLVRENKVLFGLDNEHWAYGSQISPAK